MNKRGLSDVVTTVLIILLVVAAIAAIWSFLLPTLRNTGEQLQMATTLVSLSISANSILNNPITSELSFNLKRNTGQGDLKAISVVIEDKNSKTQTKRIDFSEKFNELQTKPIKINYNQTGLAELKKFSVYPIVTENNKEFMTNNHLEQEIPEFTLFNGLVAYWKFDEQNYTGQGNEIKDFTGNHDGQARHGLSIDSGKLGNAVYFNGTGSITVSSLDASGSNLTADYTFLSWIRPTVNNGAFIAKTHGIWNGNDKVFFVNGIGGLEFQSWGNGLNSSAKQISLNTWSFIGMTYQRLNYTTGIITFYINGTKDDRRGLIKSSEDPDTSVFTIGRIVGASNNFVGKADEIMFFNRTLTPEEVAQIYSFYPNN